MKTSIGISIFPDNGDTTEILVKMQTQPCTNRKKYQEVAIISSVKEWIREL